MYGKISNNISFLIKVVLKVHNNRSSLVKILGNLAIDPFARQFRFNFSRIGGIRFMAKKLYVGNLPFSTTDQELSDIFSQMGEVLSAKIITDRNSGRSKGFGFVEMKNEGEAEQAISQYHGAELYGRALVVNEAKPMVPGGNGGGNRAFSGPKSGGGYKSGGFGGNGNRRNNNTSRW